MPEKYDLKKIMAEIKDDIDHEAKVPSQDENISQPVITALKDKLSRHQKRGNA